MLRSRAPRGVSKHGPHTVRVAHHSAGVTPRDRDGRFAASSERVSLSVFLATRELSGVGWCDSLWPELARCREAVDVEWSGTVRGTVGAGRAGCGAARWGAAAPAGARSDRLAQRGDRRSGGAGPPGAGGVGVRVDDGFARTARCGEGARGRGGPAATGTRGDGGVVVVGNGRRRGQRASGGAAVRGASGLSLAVRRGVDELPRPERLPGGPCRGARPAAGGRCGGAGGGRPGCPRCAGAGRDEGESLGGCQLVPPARAPGTTGSSGGGAGRAVAGGAGSRPGGG